MEEFLQRQLDLLNSFICEYKDGILPLNLFIQRMEGIVAAVDSAEFRDSTFPILLSMEQINADAIDNSRKLTDSEKDIINKSMVELEQLGDAASRNRAFFKSQATRQ
ncbi:hypothetical protein [Acidovorax sp. FG27]|uniref:hypothetical protein n=1 Tax=Acidovorax sp. FG27 TaxID=3133652 RepID=UPI0030EA4B11